MKAEADTVFRAAICRAELLQPSQRCRRLLACYADYASTSSSNTVFIQQCR
jgi:hypothetical protein